jgi:hypothetical protein
VFLELDCEFLSAQFEQATAKRNRDSSYVACLIKALLEKGEIAPNSQDVGL